MTQETVRAYDADAALMEELCLRVRRCWSTHGSISSPRHFTYWRAEALRPVVEASAVRR